MNEICHQIVQTKRLQLLFVMSFADGKNVHFSNGRWICEERKNNTEHWTPNIEQWTQFSENRNETIVKIEMCRRNAFFFSSSLLVIFSVLRIYLVLLVRNSNRRKDQLTWSQFFSSSCFRWQSGLICIFLCFEIGKKLFFWAFSMSWYDIFVSLGRKRTRKKNVWSVKKDERKKIT